MPKARNARGHDSTPRRGKREGILGTAAAAGISQGGNKWTRKRKERIDERTVCQEQKPVCVCQSDAGRAMATIPFSSEERPPSDTTWPSHRRRQQRAEHPGRGGLAYWQKQTHSSHGLKRRIAGACNTGDNEAASATICLACPRDSRGGYGSPAATLTLL
jgi:hypothetical protein